MFVYIQGVPRAKLVADAELLDVVIEVIGEKGPSGFTLAEVGSRVALSPSTLIQRFGTKQSLVARAIDRSNERLKATVNEAKVPRDAPLDGLVEWLADLAEPLRTRELLAAHLAFLRQDVLDAPARRQARRHSRLVRRRIQQFLSASSGGGYDDLEEVAAALEAHWHGLVIQWAIAGSGNLRGWLQHGLRVFLQALWPDSAGAW